MNVLKLVSPDQPDLQQLCGQSTSKPNALSLREHTPQVGHFCAPRYRSSLPESLLGLGISVNEVTGCNPFRVYAVIGCRGEQDLRGHWIYELWSTSLGLEFKYISMVLKGSEQTLSHGLGLELGFDDISEDT